MENLSNKQALLNTIHAQDIVFISKTNGVIKNVNKELVYPFIQDAIDFLAQEVNMNAEKYYEDMEQIDLDVIVPPSGNISIRLSGTIFDIAKKLQDACLWQKIMLAQSIYLSQKRENKALKELKSIISENESEDWKLAQKLFLKKEDGGVGEKALLDMFGTANAGEVLKLHDKADLLECIKNYQKEISVDDIVKTAFGKEGIVISVNNELIKLLHNGFKIETYHIKELTKTGRTCQLSKECKY